MSDNAQTDLLVLGAGPGGYAAAFSSPLNRKHECPLFPFPLEKNELTPLIRRPIWEQSCRFVEPRFHPPQSFAGSG